MTLLGRTRWSGCPGGVVFLIGWRVVVRVGSVGVCDGRGVGHKRWKLEINSES